MPTSRINILNIVVTLTNYSITMALSISVKRSILDVWHSSEYASVQYYAANAIDFWNALT